MRLFASGALAVLITAVIVSASFAETDISFLCKEHIQKGDALYDSFKNEEALTEYKKAYELDQACFEALLKVTRTYIDIGEDLNSKESQECYSKALEYSKILQEKYPDSYYSFNCLAVSYGYIALFEGGREKVKLSRLVVENALKAIELNPDYEVPYIVLGNYYREVASLSVILKAFAKMFFGDIPQGSYEESVDMLRKAIAIKPDSVYAHFELAKTFQSMRRYEDAAECLENVSSLPISDHLDSKLKFQSSAMAKIVNKKAHREFAKRHAKRLENNN